MRGNLRFAAAGSLLFALLGMTGQRTPEFVDIAAKSGLNDVFYCGSDTAKKYIIEALGGGVALIDYDNDGYLDVFFVSGSRLEGFPPGQEPSNQLYRNNRDGSFTRITKEAGLIQTGDMEDDVRTGHRGPKVRPQHVPDDDFDTSGFEDAVIMTDAVTWLLRQPADFTGQILTLGELRRQGVVRPPTRAGRA